MPDPEYLPIPAHVYTLACALVTMRHEDESPVVIRVEVLTSGDPDSTPASAAVADNIYPVTFAATYTMGDEQPLALSGKRHEGRKFAGWQCLHPVADGSGGRVESGKVAGDVDNA